MLSIRRPYLALLTITIFICLTLLFRASQSNHHAPPAKVTDKSAENTHKTYTDSPVNPYPTIPGPRAKQKTDIKAVLFGLVRNSDIEELITTMLQIEHNFNSRYHYPYVFVNDADFTDEFKRKVLAVTDSKVTFGKLPKEHWGEGKNVDQNKAAKLRKELEAQGVAYAGSESYRR
ncbi:alpha 1,2-mannosyltransferase 2.4.1, partial [Blyttiomyces sp. JEL0837]